MISYYHPDSQFYHLRRIHMKMKCLIIAATFALTACGGGGGGKSNSNSASSSAAPVDPSTVTTPLTPSQQDADAAQAAIDISGLYAVGTSTDSTYLYIDSITGSKDLKITAYNYIGDSYDISHGSSGANCYRVANGADTNSILNSPTSITYIPATNNKENPKYRILIGSTNLSVEWILTRNNTTFNLLNVSAGTTSGQHVAGDVDGSHYSFGVTKDPSLTISNIQSHMCVGDDLTGPTTTAGIIMPAVKNYSGLYDVSLTDNTFSTPRKFEAYLQIDEDGTINTYHYAGDGFNQGTDPKINKGNCYELSQAYNNDLNGTKLKFDKVSNQFYAYGGNDSKLFWIMDSSNTITSVGIAINNLNAKTPTTTGENVSEPGELTISSKKAQSLTVETIKNQICK
jgi:hypothetical protein